jgi:RHS repeat-associated protein
MMRLANIVAALHRARIILFASATLAAPLFAQTPPPSGPADAISPANALALASLGTPSTPALAALPALFTGAVSATVPVGLPPGRGGAQPQLTIAYRSDLRNASLGGGWIVETSAIERSVRDGVQYASGGPFVLRSGGTVADLVEIAVSEYQLKIEPGASLRIRKLTPAGGGEWWEVTDRLGTRHVYGQSSAAREFDPADPNRTFAWLLEQSIDPHGNWVSYTYTRDNQLLYVTEIAYSGHANLAPNYKLTLGWSAGPRYHDYLRNYDALRGMGLDTLALTGGGNRIWKMTLEYASVAGAPRQISRVHYLGADGSAQTPPVTLDYAPLPPPLAQTWNGGPVPGDLIGKQCFSLDLNADGRSDLACYTTSGDGWHVTIAGASGWASSTAWQGPAPNAPTNERCFPGDYNADGRGDIACWVGGSNWQVGLSTGSSFQVVTWTGPTPGQALPPDIVVIVVINVVPTANSCVPGDFNGDSRTDIVCFKGNGDRWEVGLASPAGNFAVAERGGPQPQLPVGRQCHALDLTGDRRTDLACYTGAGGRWQAAISHANGSAWDLLDFPGGPGPGDPIGAQCIPGDFNGDQKGDTACYTGAGGNWHVALSKGSGWDSSMWAGGPAPPRGNTSQCLSGDYNGDTKTDVACYASAGVWTLATSTGAGWQTTPRAGPAPKIRVIPLPFGQPLTFPIDEFGLFCTGADLSGDGTPDILCHRDGGSWEVSSIGGGTSGLLGSVQNPTGGVTQFTWGSSSDTADYVGPFAFPVLTSLVVNDGFINGTTTFAYSGARFHIPERDFRGFAKARVTEPHSAGGTFATTEIVFHQGNHPAGDATAAAPVGYMKGKPVSESVFDPSGMLLQRRDYAYAVDDAAPHANLVAAVHTTTFGRTTRRETRVEFDYDTYGNILEERDHGDTADNSDDRTFVYTYAINRPDWLVGFVSTKEIHEGIPRAKKVSATRYFYDGVTDCSTPSFNVMPARGAATRIVRERLEGGQSVEVRTAFDRYGNLICSRDANGGVNTATYDTSRSFLLAERNPAGHTLTRTYYGVNGRPVAGGAFGLLESTTDPNGAVTRYGYDSASRIVRLDYADRSWRASNYLYTGDPTRQHVRVETSEGVVFRSFYDGLGRVRREDHTGAEGHTVEKRSAYDARGFLASVAAPSFDTDPRSRLKRYEYDALGRITKISMPDGTTSTTCYEPGTIHSLGATGDLRREVHDARGNLTSVVEFTGTYTTCDAAAPTVYAVTKFTYSALGDLTSVVDAHGNRTDLRYDSLGRKVEVIDPDFGRVQYTYDANGNVLSRVDGRTGVFYAYDALNRILQKDLDRRKPLGQGDVRYRYDEPGADRFSVGRLSRVIDLSGSTSFFYDPIGRTSQTVKVIGNDSYTVRTAFDGAGRITSVTYPDGDVATYDYDGFYLTSVKLGGAPVVSYSRFTPLGQPQSATLGNGITTSYDYCGENGSPCIDPNSRLARYTITAPDAQTITSRVLTYARNGNLVEIRDPGQRLEMRYDEFQRLTEVLPFDAAGTPGTPLTYRYDEIGNIVHSSTAGTYVYPSGAQRGPRHGVIAIGGRTFSYDPAGNLNSDSNPRRRFTYDAENRLIGVTTPEREVRFGYDGDGGRVIISDMFRKTGGGAVTVGGSQTHLVSRLYACQGSDCVKFVHVGDQRIAAKPVRAGALLFFNVDERGSITVVSDASGTVLRAPAYDPWGVTKSVPPDGEMADVLRYTGTPFDGAAALYYMGSRYYDPTIGRFITPDATVPTVGNPQLLNRYTYAINSPYVLVDPNGDNPLAVILVGALVGAFAAGAQSDWDTDAMILGAFIGAISSGVGYGVGLAAGGGILGGAAGGAAGGATSAALYQSAGYDADIGRSALAGFFGGAFGSIATSVSGPLVGGAAGGAVSSMVAGGDPGEGALWGMGSAIATAVGDYYLSDDRRMTESGDEFKKTGKVELIAVRRGLWALILGDPFSHVFVSFGDGTFADSQNCASGPCRSGVYDLRTEKGMARYKENLAGSKYTKVELHIDPATAKNNAQSVQKFWGFSRDQIICTTYARVVSSGTLSGFFPGQMYFNASGTNVGYNYYSYNVYGLRH